MTAPASEQGAGDRAEDAVDRAEDLVRRLADAGQSVATAESLTAGLVAAALADVPGASAVLRGGVVSYATEVKAEVLGVDAELLARRGTVDPDVALAMASGARRVCGSDWGLATTGVAGPGPHEGKPAGTVFVAVAGPSGEDVRALRLDGARAAVRRGAVEGVLGLLSEVLAR